MVKLYPEYRGNEANIHKFAYLAAVVLPLYYIQGLQLTLCNWLLAYWDSQSRGLAAFKVCVLALIFLVPVMAFPIVWTHESLEKDGKIAWSVFGGAVAFNVWIWFPLAWQFIECPGPRSAYPHKYFGRHRSFIFFVLVVFTLLSFISLLSVGWAVSDLSAGARAGYTAAGVVMAVGTLQAVTIRNTTRFIVRL